MSRADVAARVALGALIIATSKASVDGSGRVWTVDREINLNGPKYHYRPADQGNR